VTPALEARYRRALRWYPASWRAANEDVIVGTLLDGAEGRVAPRAGELANLVVHGMVARVAPLGRVLPASVRNAASTLALGFGFGLAVVMLVMQEWAPWATEIPTYYPTPSATEPVLMELAGPFSGWGGVLYLAWVAAFVLFALGLTIVARWLLVATVPFSVLIVLAHDGIDVWFRPTSEGLVILGSLALIVAIGRPFSRRTSWLPFAAVALYAGLGVLLPLLRNVEITTRLDPRSMWNFVDVTQSIFAWTIYIIAGTILIALAARQWKWAGAMVVVSLPLVGVSLARLVDNGYDGSAVVLIGVVALGVGAIVAARMSGLRLVVVREP